MWRNYILYIYLRIAEIEDDTTPGRMWLFLLELKVDVLSHPAGSLLAAYSTESKLTSMKKIV